MTTPRLKLRFIRVNKHEDDDGKTTFRIFWGEELVGNVFILDHQAKTFSAKAIEIEGMIRMGTEDHTDYDLRGEQIKAAAENEATFVRFLSVKAGLDALREDLNLAEEKIQLELEKLDQRLKGEESHDN